MKKVPQEASDLPGHETKALFVQKPLVSPPIIGKAFLKIYSSSYQSIALMPKCLARVVPSFLNKMEGDLSMKHHKFWTQSLFKKRDEVQMSFQEIADFFGVSRTSAKNYIKRDVEAQFIEKWNHFSESKKTGQACQRKNIDKLKEAKDVVLAGKR